MIRRSVMLGLALVMVFSSAYAADTFNVVLHEFSQDTEVSQVSEKSTELSSYIPLAPIGTISSIESYSIFELLNHSNDGCASTDCNENDNKGFSVTFSPWFMVTQERRNKQMCYRQRTLPSFRVHRHLVQLS